MVTVLVQRRLCFKLTLTIYSTALFINSLPDDVCVRDRDSEIHKNMFIPSKEGL